MQQLQEMPVQSLSEEDRQPTPVFLHGEGPGQRSLVGYSPRVAESDAPEHTRVHAVTRLSTGRRKGTYTSSCHSPQCLIDVLYKEMRQQCSSETNWEENLKSLNETDGEDILMKR